LASVREYFAEVNEKNDGIFLGKVVGQGEADVNTQENRVRNNILQLQCQEQQAGCRESARSFETEGEVLRQKKCGQVVLKAAIKRELRFFADRNYILRCRYG